MAKATKKTSHKSLYKQLSPQKHMIKAQGFISDDNQGQINKVRGE